MFSLGGSELLIVGLLALLLFGPDKLPQMARTVGKLMREFNKYKDIMESSLRSEIYAAEHQAPDAPAVDEMADLEKSAAASREYAASQVVRDDEEGESEEEAPEAPTGPVPADPAVEDAAAAETPAPARVRARRASPIATDEDEEEGD